MQTGPKILALDIETAPVLAYCWGLFDQNIGLNQIKSDWHLLSVSAKWLNEPASKVMYVDQRRARDIEDDRELLKFAWKLLDECDVLLTQNGVKFDSKKLNARFVLNGFKPPSPYKHIDTLKIAKKRFAFTSNKLEYMSDKLCTKYKKLKSTKFPGFELWKQCLSGNLDAWKEMERYNCHDVLALEELYSKLQPWDSPVNLSLYHDDGQTRCDCGSTQLTKRGYNYTEGGKFQRLQCTACGAWMSLRQNLLGKNELATIKKRIV